MIHELKEIINKAIANQKIGLKSVLATVVFLNGSSYRKPGVRMLISEDLKATGAVSGGCVEKEIIQRSSSVFKTDRAKVITYDGRYRLGCEGILYILLEPFYISEQLLLNFNKTLQNRETLKIKSYYEKEDDISDNFGSLIQFNNGHEFSFLQVKTVFKEDNFFTQLIKPTLRLIIIGGEHDAVKLCKIASQLGWQVDIKTSAKDSKLLSDFPGAASVKGTTPETFTLGNLDDNTVVVIMNHSYSLDLQYLIKLSKLNLKYIGVLGAPKRRERMLNDLFELFPSIEDTFIDTIFTPAGLQIGAKTPEEIAISIIAEILTIIRNKNPQHLRELNGKINVIND